MKLAFVSDAIYPYNKGGKEKRLFDITTRLASRGRDVHIYCMKWWDTAEKERVENGVHFHAICPYIPLYSGERRSIYQGIMFGFSCLKLLFHNWDVIDVDHMPFFPLYFCKLVCMVKRKKMIATWHEIWGRDYWVKYMGWRGNIAWIIERMSVLCPDHILVNIEATKQKLQSKLGYRKSITIIPIGITFKEIQKISPSQMTSDVIFSGRLLKHKNVHLLLQAIAHLKKIQAIIVGNGPEKKSLRSLANKLKVEDRVTFYDFIPDHNGLIALMKSSRLFVLPSEREGFGIVTLEANACGIPVIVLDHEENHSSFLITGEIGLLCQPNARDIARKIELLLSKKDTSIRHACLENAKKYSWDDLIERYEQFYLSS